MKIKKILLKIRLTPLNKMKEIDMYHKFLMFLNDFDYLIKIIMILLMLFLIIFVILLNYMIMELRKLIIKLKKKMN